MTAPVLGLETPEQKAARLTAEQKQNTLTAAGAVRANGTLSLLVTGIGAGSACRALFNFTELR